MPTLIAVRHPEDVLGAMNILNGQKDSNLTNKGEVQKKELGIKIKEEHPEVKTIFSSPLRRAHLAAIECQMHLNVPLLVNRELIERDCGVCTGIPYQQLKLHADKFRKSGNHFYVEEARGYENDKTLKERAELVLAEIESYSRILGFGEKDKILIVSHGAILTAMKLVVMRLPHTDFHSVGKIANADPFLLKSW